MPKQQELDAIWENAKTGAYKNNAGEMKPEICADDSAEQVISIPNQDGTARELYRRGRGGGWESVPHVGDRRAHE